MDSNVLDALGSDPEGANLESDGCEGDLSPNPDGCGQADRENWAPGTAVVAAGFDWTPGAIRVIVPITDEGPCLGGQSTLDEGCAENDCAFACCDDAADDSAIANAIDVATAQAPQVIVSPIISRLSEEFLPCVVERATLLANATGGMAVTSETETELFAGAISNIVLDACETFCGLNPLAGTGAIPTDMVLGGNAPGVEGDGDSN